MLYTLLSICYTLQCVACIDLDSVIDIVYNPSAGPFQDNSNTFYKPSPVDSNNLYKPTLEYSNNLYKPTPVDSNNLYPLGKEGRKIDEMFVFPGRLDTKNRKQGTVKKAKLLRGGKKIDVEGGLDFGLAVFDERMGKRCILKKEEIDTVERTPTLVCTHRYQYLS